MLLASVTGAIERFPPPDFGPEYVYPDQYQAPARGGWLAWMDVAVLLGALTAAALIVYYWRSRRAMFWLSIFSLIYFGFYRLGCVCPIGSIQNVSQGLFDSGYIVPVTVLLFFALPLIFSLMFGRVFCGGVCPIGALQDVVMVKSINVPRWLDRGLRTIPFIYLGLAVLLAATSTRYIICHFDPMVSFFRMGARLDIWIWSGAVLLLSVFLGRPYCRYLCPYGVLLGLFSKNSYKRVTITPDKCITCSMCHEACPLGAINDGRLRGKAE